MTGKLEGFQAISTNTTTNGYCQKQYNKQDPKNICTFCYSHEMLNTFRKNMAPALQRNTDLLNSKVLHPDALPVINSAFFRSEYVLYKKFMNCIRNSPLVSKSMLILNFFESSRKKSTILRSGSGMDATIASVSISFKKQFKSVVFPVPTSPVSKRNPLFS